jgi:hypothetical protein
MRRETVTTDGFTSLAQLLPGAIAALRAELAAIEEQMKALQAQGLIHARPEWRPSNRGDYLTLIYAPNADEKRPRRHIGNDLAKVSEALASMERAEQYDQLARRLQLLQGASCAAYCQLHELFRTLTTPR